MCEHAQADEGSREDSGVHPIASPDALEIDFAHLYDAWFDHIVRWVKALGAPQADTEDLAQEVFMVVRRRLSDFDGRNMAGWIYRITSRQVRQYRRRSWARLMFARRDGVELEELPHSGVSALATLETKEKQQLFDSLTSKITAKRRVVFRLFELEGYDGQEIADILGVPINTVWTRLHYARKDFSTLLARYRTTARDDA